MSDSIEWPPGTLWKVLAHYHWDLPSPRSGWFTIKCHEHKDSHASCRVNDTLGAVKCQGCDFGGDIIAIVRYYEGRNADFKTTLAIAEDIAGESHCSVRGLRGGRGPVSPRARAHQGNGHSEQVGIRTNTRQGGR